MAIERGKSKLHNKHKTTEKPKGSSRYLCRMISRFLLAIAIGMTGNGLLGQQALYHVSLALEEDLRTVRGHVHMELPVSVDSLPEKIWLEFWPLAYSQPHSVLADQWLEDQQTRFHFSKAEERVQLDTLWMVEGQGKRPLHYSEGRSPELLFLYRDSLKDARPVINAHFQLRLPINGWDDFGWREDGLLLNHCYLRFSAFDGEQFLPSPALRSADRNAQDCGVFLEIQLPAFYFPITPLPEAGEERWNGLFQLGDKDFLQTPRTHQFSDPQHSGDLPLFISNHARIFKTEVPQVRPVWAGNGPVLPETEEVICSFQRMRNWLKQQYDYQDSLLWTLVFTEASLPEESSLGLLFCNTRNPGPYTELSMASRYFRAVLSSRSNGHASPWLSSGLAHYMAYEYLATYYPEQSLGGPFENSLIARFFKVDELPIGYSQQLLYLYLARQGLDQSVTDSAEAFTRGTYDAEMKGKTVMQLNYLHDYVGDRRFRQAIADFLKSDRKRDQLEKALTTYQAYKPLDWFFDDMQQGAQPLDLRLHKTEACESLFVVTTSARKGGAMPYPVSGYIGDSLVMTEWFGPHEKKQGKNFYKADYDQIVVADPLRYPDLFGKNNLRKTSGLFKGGKPLELQLYTSLENPNKNQIYWLPSASYNAYDQLSVGVSLFNTTLIPKKFEYRLGPEYSTGTGEITGFGYVGVNFPLFEGPVRLISGGVFYRRYHYAPDLAYNRVSPAITLHFRKPFPRSPYIRRLRIRHVLVDLELPAGENGVVGETGYSVFNMRYTSEYTHVLRPHTLKADFQLGDLFSKLSVEWDQRWMLRNRKWMILRLFAGWMPYNNNPTDIDLFDFGLSGTQDYLFDYYFIGRSEESGIWSQQFFITDGGFRANTRQFGRTHLVSANLSLPLYSVFGLYGDVGTIGGPVEWGYGVRIALFTDFLEWYFPIQSRKVDHYAEAQYLSHTRFVLDLDLDAIINRLRRGFY